MRYTDDENRNYASYTNYFNNSDNSTCCNNDNEKAKYEFRGKNAKYNNNANGRCIKTK